MEEAYRQEGGRMVGVRLGLGLVWVDGEVGAQRVGGQGRGEVGW